MSNIKVVLIGDTSVGKTSIADRFVNNQFSEFNEPTIGAAFLAKNLNNIRFEIWDTAGQERYRALAPMYYRGASAALVVFDLTNRESFQNAKPWINELKEKGKENCIIILIGNKCDLPNREVYYDSANKFAEDNDIFFLECSAKNDINIEDAFIIIKNNYIPNEENDFRSNINFTPKKKLERKCC